MNNFQKHPVLTKSLSLIGIVLTLSVSSHALAAQPADLTGSWERVSGVRAVTGTVQHKRPTVLTTEGESGLKTLRILEQNGAAFAGEAQLVDGEPHLIAGALRQDGKNFVISSDIGALSGKTEGQHMEVCFTTLMTDINIAGCYQLKRTK
jgi:hypothetical protein